MTQKTKEYKNVDELRNDILNDEWIDFDNSEPKNFDINEIDFDWKYEDEHFSRYHSDDMKSWSGINHRIMYYVKQNTDFFVDDQDYFTTYIGDIGFFILIVTAIFVLLFLLINLIYIAGSILISLLTFDEIMVIFGIIFIAYFYTIHKDTPNRY